MDHILPEPQEGCDKSFLGMLRQNESLKEDQRISEWLDEKKVDKEERKIRKIVFRVKRWREGHGTREKGEGEGESEYK